MATSVLCLLGLLSVGRTWTDATGKYKVDASLVDTDGTVVQLRKGDGSIVSIPVSKLSIADREWVAKLPEVVLYVVVPSQGNLTDLDAPRTQIEGIEPDSWKSVGGPNLVVRWSPNPGLIVVAPMAIHERIRKELPGLRAVKRRNQQTTSPRDLGNGRFAASYQVNGIDGQWLDRTLRAVVPTVKFRLAGGKLDVEESEDVVRLVGQLVGVLGAVSKGTRAE